MIEYLPYGETLYDEAATADKTEFRFTSKEQDAETGLYYHGARYRDAKTGVWLSVDPILESYLEGEPAGGVFNSINMNLYHYAGNNPTRFIDPDGENSAICTQSSHVAGYGHSGMWIENANGTYTMYDKINYDPKFSYKDQETGKTYSAEWASVKKIDNAVLASSAEQAGAVDGNAGIRMITFENKTILNRYLNERGYDNVTEFNTSPSEDKKMSNYIRNNDWEAYQFFSANCVHAVQKTLSQVGINASESKLAEKYRNSFKGWRWLLYSSDMDKKYMTQDQVNNAAPNMIHKRLKLENSARVVK